MYFCGAAYSSGSNPEICIEAGTILGTTFALEFDSMGVIKTVNIFKLLGQLENDITI